MTNSVSKTLKRDGKENGAYQMVISSVTMISSFTISAVNVMATTLKNSFSNRTR